MGGLDPGAVALNFITYFGGGAGASISAAAILLVFLLCACHAMDRRAGWLTTTLVIGAWTASWVVRQLVGWA